MRYNRVKGFTLVEMIVVIAIIAVLAGMLVPAILGYVAKANRRADMANAKTIFDDVSYVLYMDETKYDGYISYGNPAALTPGESMLNWDHGSSARVKKDVIVNVGNGETENYRVCIVAYMDGVNLREDKFFVWNGSDLEEAAFATALKKLENMPERTGGLKKPTLPIRSKSYNGNDTNRWFITLRVNEDLKPPKMDINSNLEIFVGSKQGNRPIYRLYPPCEEYK